jgi:pimeloyl-ACP methyl ester carboxylesterase
VPTARTDGVDLYYELRGRGPRLLFLNGSGGTIEASGMLLAPFEAAFEVLAHDNRGLGLSSASPGAYDMATCASDAASVMDAVGWDRAAVAGISFGGMVAQELAVTVPGRVTRLALLCTSPGGPDRSSYPLHELADLPAEERAAQAAVLLDTRFDDEWLAAHASDRQLVALLAQRSSAPDADGGHGSRAQLEARRTHDVWDRLPRITCPTLVACGRFDGIAPPANSEAIASRVEGAELRTYEGGHAFVAQDPHAFPDILAFLAGSGYPAGRAG